MPHEPLTFNFTSEWARKAAANEPESGMTSVGGLAIRMGEDLTTPREDLEIVQARYDAKMAREKAERDYLCALRWRDQMLCEFNVIDEDAGCSSVIMH